jgi:RimJ/RimL family protein N-acetyltransferase
MNIKPLQAMDLSWLRKLRNQERKWFFDTNLISPGQQAHWFAHLPRNRRVYIVWDGKERVGTFSIVPIPDSLPIPHSDKPLLYFSTFIIPPEHRGRGILEEAKKKFNKKHDYVGYVREDNKASFKAFKKFGMEHIYLANTEYDKVWVMLYRT